MNASHLQSIMFKSVMSAQALIMHNVLTTIDFQEKKGDEEQ